MQVLEGIGVALEIASFKEGAQPYLLASSIPKCLVPIDQLVDGRFSAGAFIAQSRLPMSQRLEPFYQVTEARREPGLFQRSFQQQKPDLILTLYHVVDDLLKEMGLRIPRDIGLLQLEWHKDRADWAGMDQHNDLVGEAAVEMVINMIQNYPPGLPDFPLASLIGSTLVTGKTVRRTSSSPKSG